MKGKKGIEVVFSDHGHGIKNIDKVLKRGNSSKGSL